MKRFAFASLTLLCLVGCQKERPLDLSMLKFTNEEGKYFVFFDSKNACYYDLNEIEYYSYVVIEEDNDVVGVRLSKYVYPGGKKQFGAQYKDHTLFRGGYDIFGKPKDIYYEEVYVPNDSDGILYWHYL